VTPLRRTRIRSRSVKREAVDVEYRVFRIDYLLAHPICTFPACTAEGTDIHHRLPRSAKGPLMDEDNCAALCRSHHSWIHAHPAVAREQDWIRSRYA